MEFSGLRSQYHHPSGIFSLLMIVRGDVIQKAIAQLAGGPFHITPVAFSFGWVGYTVSALFSVIGDGRLMPDVEFSSIVMNASTGARRANRSWILARLLRDWEKSVTYDYPNPALVVTIFRMLGDARTQGENTDRERGRVPDLERNKKARVDPGKSQPGVPDVDFQWYTGLVVMIAQLIIAAVVGILHKQWLTMIVTFSGTCLCLVGGALPQLKREKWSCRKLSENTKQKKTIILTQGNGHRHVMIIHSDGRGLDLEDLATGRLVTHRSTLPCLLLLTSFWLILLLTVGNFSGNSWWLVAVGALGMAQNIFAAGHHRDPSTKGIHLDKPDLILPEPSHEDEHGKEVCNKVFQVLKKTEMKMSEEYGVNGAGLWLLPIFFEHLRPDEITWRDQLKAKYVQEAETQGSQVEQSRSQAPTDNLVQGGPTAEVSSVEDGPQRYGQSFGELMDQKPMASGSITAALA